MNFFIISFVWIQPGVQRFRFWIYIPNLEFFLVVGALLRDSVERTVGWEGSVVDGIGQSLRYI